MNFILWTETKPHICLILHGFGYLDLIDAYSPGLGCDNCVLLPEVADKEQKFMCHSRRV